MINAKAQTKSDLVEFRRGQILKAAEKVFAEKGYHRTNIADIAAELGMGHGTFYRYFKNKRDIFVNVLDEVIGKMTTVVAGADPTATNSIEEYRAQVIGIGEKLLGLFIEDPMLAKLLFYESWGLDEEMRERVWRMMDVFGKFTELYLINGKTKGFLRSGLDTTRTAQLINSAIFEAARRISRSGDFDGEKDHWVEAVVCLMFEGLRG